MIYESISGINACIAAAERLSHGIIRESGNVAAIEKASRLDVLLKDIQAHVTAIQSEYIRLLRDHDTLEQELVAVRAGDCRCNHRRP